MVKTIGLERCNQMRKRIISAILCVVVGMFCTLGCEKQSDEEKAAKDAAKKVDKASKDVVKDVGKALD